MTSAARWACGPSVRVVRSVSSCAGRDARQCSANSSHVAGEVTEAVRSPELPARDRVFAKHGRALHPGISVWGRVNQAVIRATPIEIVWIRPNPGTSAGVAESPHQLSKSLTGALPHAAVHLEYRPD